jgi:DNA helicase-2/ATP-dependent DNA helicase PcrA
MSKESPLLTGLSSVQRAAVIHTGGPLLVLAGAGAGKTRVLATRAAWLVEQGRDPARIVVATFTNRATAEFKGRLAELMGDRSQELWMGTLHAVGSRLLRRHGHLGDLEKEFRIIGPAQVRDRLREIAALYQLKQPRLRIAREAISRFKGMLVGPADVTAELLWNMEPIAEEVRFLYERYEQSLRENGELDLDDLILRSAALLAQAPEVGAQLGVEAVLVDEAQDVDPAQLALIRLLLGSSRCLTLVADGDQCQPPGTQVLTDQGPVAIEALDPAHHRLVSYVKGELIGRRRGYSFDVAVRQYSGPMVIVRSGGRETRCTPCHRWNVRWNKAAHDRNASVVYLMQRGQWFRIGWCQLFSAEGAFHLGLRARIEKADKIWILRAFAARPDAARWESILAARYGIPTATFQPLAGVQWMDEEWTAGVFEGVGPELVERAHRCLGDHGRMLEYPIWQKLEPGVRRGRTLIHQVRACNLVPGWMDLPIDQGSRSVVWAPVFVTRHPYEGPVYSLEVKPYETYVADGIATHNSIYAWRGAKSEHVVRFEQQFPDGHVISLGQNWRCDQRIVRAAETLIRLNRERREHKLWSDRRDGQAPIVQPVVDDEQEAEWVVAEIQRLAKSKTLPWRAFAILYRANFLSQPFEDQLVARSIPYHVLGSRFWDRREIVEVLMYLRLVLDPEDIRSLRVLADPGRGKLAQAQWSALITAQLDGQSFRDRLLSGEELPMNPDLKVRLTRIFAQVDDWRARAGQLGLAQLIMAILHESGRAAFWEKKDEEREVANRAVPNLNRLIVRTARYFAGTATIVLPAFLDYVKSMVEESGPGERDAVQLMTLHGAKGMEFPVVFVAGCEQGLLPHWQAGQAGEYGRQALEEERRLMYVGMTRAERWLYLTYAQVRRGASGLGRMAPRSQFLNEIPAELLQWRELPDREGQK